MPAPPAQARVEGSARMRRVRALEETDRRARQVACRRSRAPATGGAAEDERRSRARNRSLVATGDAFLVLCACVSAAASSPPLANRRTTD